MGSFGFDALIIAQNGTEIKRNVDRFERLCYNIYGESPQGHHFGGGCFLSFGGSVSFFAFLRTEGGGIMGEYITWDDLIKIAMLIIAIIACFKNKKR